MARWTVPFTIPAALSAGLAAVLVFSGAPPKETILKASPAAAEESAGGPALRGGDTNQAAQAAGITCSLIVPANPLTAAGLATPYQLTGPNGTNPRRSGCTMANAVMNGTFVQATILDPATGALSVYDPLVVTQGTTPAAAPVMPNVPAGAVVTVDVGYNGAKLGLMGATADALQQGNCVNGIQGSVFGEVAFCNGPQFVAAAAQAVTAKKLTVPALGMSTTVPGMPCPSTRSFALVDQDPSDNVTTKYLLNRNGQTAQATTANTTALPAARMISNASDNIDLAGFVDPALGCTPLMAPDQTQGGAMGTSQALSELSANAGQAAPQALIPLNDPMAMAGNMFSVAKVNLYRSNIGEPLIGGAVAGTTAVGGAAVPPATAAVAAAAPPAVAPAAPAVAPPAPAAAPPAVAAAPPAVTAPAAPATAPTAPVASAPPAAAGAAPIATAPAATATAPAAAAPTVPAAVPTAPVTVQTAPAATAPTAAAAAPTAPAAAAPPAAAAAPPAAAPTAPAAAAPPAAVPPAAAAAVPAMPVAAMPAAADTPGGFCQNLITIQPQFLMTAKTALAAAPSPVPGMGQNLLGFLIMRLGMSFTNLNCQNFGLKNPVQLTRNDNGVLVAASLNGMTAMIAPQAGNGQGTGTTQNQNGTGNGQGTGTPAQPGGAAQNQAGDTNGTGGGSGNRS